MDGRNTTSTLKLIPTAKDHDAELICSAFNPAMTPSSNRNVSKSDNEGNNLAARTLSSSSSSSVETRRKLVVHCKTNERTHFRPFLFSFLVVSFSLVSAPTSHSLSLITKTLSLMTKTSRTAMMRFSIMGYDVDSVIGPNWEMAREFFSFS